MARQRRYKREACALDVFLRAGAVPRHLAVREREPPEEILAELIHDVPRIESLGPGVHVRGRNPRRVGHHAGEYPRLMDSRLPQ